MINDNEHALQQRIARTFPKVTYCETEYKCCPTDRRPLYEEIPEDVSSPIERFYRDSMQTSDSKYQKTEECMNTRGLVSPVECRNTRG